MGRKLNIDEKRQNKSEKAKCKKVKENLEMAK